MGSGRRSSVLQFCSCFLDGVERVKDFPTGNARRLREEFAVMRSQRLGERAIDSADQVSGDAAQGGKIQFYHHFCSSESAVRM